MARGDMTLRAVLKLAANDFTRGISGIQKQLQGLGDYMKTAFAVGSVVSFGREMVKWTKEFEDAMARAQAVSNATAEGFKFMRDEALRLGATTRYTSVQVAQTLEVLTRNGLSATNATRILADTLRLAQANAIELSDAGNVLTNVLNMFGLSIDKAAYVTDIMSATASNSATDLMSLYEAMTNAAPMAHALGMNIEEVAAALGALANVGVKGPDAGTQLRQFLQRLTDPLAMKKMKKMTGFAFDEDFINTEGLEGVLKKLQSLGLTVTQLNEIFTVRSSKSIIQLMNSMDNFVSLLDTMKNASGTASRMFVEGVGTMRYELDILRSMWQNFLIAIGDKSEGPFLGLVKFAQNFITSLRSVGGVIGQIGVLLLVFHKRIEGFFKSMIDGANKWASQSIRATKMDRAVKLKAHLEEQKELATTSAAQKKYLADRIAAQKKIITMYNADQRAAQALKATLTSIGWAAAIVGIEIIISRIASMNAEIRQANKSVEESDKAAHNLTAKVNMLRDMIGEGKDKDSLNGAVNEARKMFSEFADAINQAYLEAGKINKYQKLKDLLSEIADLQNQIAASKAQQEMVDATRNKYAEGLWGQRANAGSVPNKIKNQLQERGADKSTIKSTLNYLADILVRNDGDLAKQVKEVGTYLKSLDIKVDTKDLEKWVKSNTNKQSTGFWGKKKDSDYAKAVNEYNKQKDLTKEISSDEVDLKWKNAINAYNAASKEASNAYKAGSQEYKEAMTNAASNLKNAVGDIVGQLSQERKDKYNSIIDKWGKGSSSYTGGDDSGSGSNKKKTPQDKFNDIIQDYIDDSKKVEEQYKNGILTQEEYRKALSDVELEALKTIAGVDELDKMLNGLPDSTKAAGKALAAMIKDYNKKAAENILLDFDQKRADISTKYENSPKGEEDLKAFNDAMDDLATETMEELQKIQNLNEILGQLNPKMKDLFDLVTFGVTANMESAKSKQLEELDKNSNDVKLPKFTTILGPDDKSVEGLKQNLQKELDKDNFFINIEMGNDEAFLDYLKEVIKNKESEITDLEEKLKNNDPSISLIRNETIERVENLKKHLTQLMDTADTLEDKLDISKMIVKLDDDIKTMSDKTLDNVSSMASAFDKLLDSVKSITEAFGMEIEFEGLEKGLSVINGVIQAIEAVKEVIETFNALQELSNKRQIKQNAELALSNAAVEMSEKSKLGVQEGAEFANELEAASSYASAQANNQQAETNYDVARSAAAKAGAEGTAAVAQGAESVSKIPYVGAIMAVAAAGAIAAALISSFSKVKGFAHGGIVPGTKWSGDQNLVRADSGEMVLTRGHQATLWNAIKTGNFGGGGKVEFVIKGDQLVGTLNNYSRIRR